MLDPHALEPGDLVLVKSRGGVFRLGRRLAGNAYDHVGVVVRDGHTINIDKPRTRLLPTERLLRASLEPLVLRPSWPSPDARDQFVTWIEQLAGRKYDVARTLRLLGRLVLRRFAGVTWPMQRPVAEQHRWICTDAVLLGFERFGAHSELLAGLPLDWNTLHCGTTNDFLVITTHEPDLLRRMSGPTLCLQRDLPT